MISKEQIVIVQESELNVKSPRENRQFVPENLSWKYLLNDESFKFIGQTQPFGQYSHLKNISYLYFIELVKSYFRESYKEILKWIPLYAKNTKDFFYCDLLIPIKLNSDYWYVKQTISPLTLKNEVFGLLFVNIPIKKYENESIEIKTYVDYEYCIELTSKIYDFVTPPTLFTYQQLTQIIYIYQNFTSNEMAILQNKTKAAIYKLNRRILEILSDFFEIEFKDAQEAVNFYYKCFPYTEI